MLAGFLAATRVANLTGIVASGSVSTISVRAYVIGDSGVNPRSLLIDRLLRSDETKF